MRREKTCLDDDWKDRLEKKKSARQEILFFLKDFFFFFLGARSLLTCRRETKKTSVFPPLAFSSHTQWTFRFCSATAYVPR